MSASIRWNQDIPHRSRARRRWMQADAPFALLALLLSCGTGSPPAQEPGWTEHEPARSTRRVYLSSSTGNDTNDGLTPDSPKATIPAATRLLRTGNPDWLLIKRGDEFRSGLGEWVRSGGSKCAPMVVTSYGNGSARPLFRCGVDDGLTMHTTAIHDVAFVGLHFVADAYDGGNGHPYGISLLSPCTRVLIEDCKIERFGTNIRFQGADHRNLELRRSVIADAFTTGKAHSQGIYVEALTGCLIEECVFDHNGWRPSVDGAVPTIFRHNIYVQGDTKKVVIRGNVIARGGSHGLQARSGGVIRDNLFLANSISLLVGSTTGNDGALQASVIGNVMLDGRDIDAAEPRGWAAQFQCLASGEIAYNVAAHQVSGTAPLCFEFNSKAGAGINNVDFHHNVSYRWGGGVSLSGTHFSAFEFRDNELQDSGSSALIRADSESPLAGISTANNRLHTGAPAGAWMFFNGRQLSLPAWKTLVADDTSVAQQVAYKNADETIAEYDRATGGSGSLDSFLARVRNQSRANWNDRLVGTNVAAHFRGNFGVVVP
ncbi:MAG TPA: right-handed parallel beta-helix repeat-containing protein [Planctomycetota bacterium]